MAQMKQPSGNEKPPAAKGAAMDRTSIVTRFHLTLLAFLVALTVIAYLKVPAPLGFPVHWGLNGHPDEVWPRSTALLLFPAIGLLLTALFFAIGLLASPQQIEPGRTVAEAMLTGFLGLLFALQLSLILIGVGSDIDLTRIVAFVVAVGLLGIGIALSRATPNAFSGVRLPWTMADKRNWTATHRLTGALMVLAGAGLGVVAFAWPDPINLFQALAVAVFLPVVVAALCSVVLAKSR
jgi:uncharacterized membrane protein